MDIGLVVGALGDGIVAMRVVICGGGVIGACTAYFLSLRQVEVVVVERTGVVCAASGKSGGFIALDWCDGSALGRLAQRDFKLRQKSRDTPQGRPRRSRWNLGMAVATSLRLRGQPASSSLPDWVLGSLPALLGRLWSCRCSGTPGGA